MNWLMNIIYLVTNWKALSQQLTRISRETQPILQPIEANGDTLEELGGKIDTLNTELLVTLSKLCGLNNNAKGCITLAPAELE